MWLQVTLQTTALTTTTRLLSADSFTNNDNLCRWIVLQQICIFFLNELNTKKLLAKLKCFVSDIPL